MALIRTVLAVALAALTIARASAQAPDQTIRIVLPYPAGGAGDVTARLIADVMRVELKQAVIVENKPGAAGRLGIQFVKDAPADGSVLLFVPIAPMAVFPHVYDKLGYDPVADFAPVSQVATFDMGVAVGANSAKSLAELVAAVKQKPELATYGTPAAGSLPHFFAVLFSQRSGVELRHVAYKGNPQAIADLIGGHLPIFFTSSQDLVEAHKAGSIRLLATSGAMRSPVLADVPTFEESGYGIRGEGWYGIYAPAKTPNAVVDRHSTAIATAVASPAVRQRLLALGLVPTGTTGSQLAAIQKRDSDQWGPVVKTSGFKPD